MSENVNLATNRKAQHDYFIKETFEAGIQLKGSEIKSLRKRQVSLKESFARVEKGGIVLYNLHINPYEFARRDEIDPKRPRRLLLRKRETKDISGKTSEKGLALIPLKIYLKKSFAKVEIALVKGKKFYDKRHDIKAKASKREIDRALREKRK